MRANPLLFMYGIRLQGELMRFTNTWNAHPYYAYVVTLITAESERRRANFVVSKPLSAILQERGNPLHMEVGQMMLFLSENREKANLVYPEPFKLPLKKGIARECQLKVSKMLAKEVPELKHVQIIQKTASIETIIKYLQARVAHDRTRFKARYANVTREKKKAMTHRIRKKFLRRKP